MRNESSWGEILAEYRQGKSRLDKFHGRLRGDPQSAAADEISIVVDMCSEIRENISHVKRNYNTELQHYLKSERSLVLTDRQHQIMTMRSKGMTMDEIALSFGISKTAVYKTIRLSEKKIKC